MDISTTQTYNTSPSAVAQAFLSSELAAKWAKLTRIDDYTHTVDGSKAATVVNVSAERLPSKVRTFARNGAKVTVTTVASGGGVTYAVDPHDLPAKVSTALKLSDDATTTADLSTTLKTKIPFLGEKIEKRTAGVIDRLLAKDARLIEGVIEEQGS